MRATADDTPQVVVFALCGSFCTFEAVLPQIQRLCAMGWEVLPLLSYSAATLDTRFGRAADWKAALEELTGHAPLTTLQEAEPLGPKRMARAMVIAPCTGTTMVRLAQGLSDTPVTLAAKSMLRGGRPIILAPSTNDGLSGSAVGLAQLLQRKYYYFVPFGQDDSFKKPHSLKSDMSLLPDTLACALSGIQLQPLLL
ncbi:MAG: dipicolinate synthase subunit B [Gemmiger sp.]|nr:dipicolinate synthase subunit B [Gemmiger sp.]